MEHSLTTHDLHGLARAIDQQGIDSVPATLIRTFAEEAGEVGASATLTTLIVDPTEPRVARERAFQKLGACVIGARSRQRRARCSQHTTAA